MPNLLTIFAENIKTRRKVLGMSQEKLAELANTATTYIAMIETKRRKPSFSMIEHIADALEIEAYELFIPPKKSFKSDSKVREGLFLLFDQFVRDALNEIVEDKNKQE